MVINEAGAPDDTGALSFAAEFPFFPASVSGQIPGATGTESPGLSLAERYLDQYANVVQPPQNLPGRKVCPGHYITAQCENGHRFAKKLCCGREWCPTCGAKESDVHLRRFARWVPKIEQMKSMGYLVFTIPEELRWRYRKKAALTRLAKLITNGDKSNHLSGMLKEMGFGRGLARWHFFGDEGDRYHPHLNVIIDAGYLPRKKLELIRRRFAEILGVELAVVNYSYTRNQAKMVHAAKYVTRATFLDYEWDSRMAEELYNFRNQRSWGDWSGPVVWELKGESKYAHIEDLEKGICPICGKPLKWHKPLPIALMSMEAWQDIGAGYFQLNDLPPP